jgi:hypothetical protein
MGQLVGKFAVPPGTAGVTNLLGELFEPGPEDGIGHGNLYAVDFANGSAPNALDFPASLVFKGRDLFITNLSLSNGGVNSKLSVLIAPNPGLPLAPD